MDDEYNVMRSIWLIKKIIKRRIRMMVQIRLDI